MLKNLLFLFLIIGSVAGAVFIFNARPKETGQATAVAQTPVASAPKKIAYQEKNGIQITIEAVEQRADATVVKLALNNHQYDLSKNEIYEKATLGGQSPLSRAMLSNASGGHHVETEIFFPKTKNGNFVIEPAEGTSFTFNDLWK